MKVMNVMTVLIQYRIFAPSVLILIEHISLVLNVLGKSGQSLLSSVIFPQQELVRKSGSKLKGTNFSLGEQFPKVIQDRRRLLLPIFKRAKSEGRRASLVRDKLYIGGRLYKENVAPQGQRSSRNAWRISV